MKTKDKIIALNDRMDQMETDLNHDINEMVEDIKDDIRDDVDLVNKKMDKLIKH